MNIRLYWHASMDADPDNQWLRENLLSVFDTDRSPMTGSNKVYREW